MNLTQMDKLTQELLSYIPSRYDYSTKISGSKLQNRYSLVINADNMKIKVVFTYSHNGELAGYHSIVLQDDTGFSFIDWVSSNDDGFVLTYKIALETCETLLYYNIKR